jgi:hypothetical protein
MNEPEVVEMWYPEPLLLKTLPQPWAPLPPSRFSTTMSSG